MSEANGPQPPASEMAAPLAWPLGPHLLVFFSSSCIMALELVAGRLIAQYVGNSLYTWTSIIGVVLAGITIGNGLGGKLADRRAPAAYLGWLFLAASFVCFLTLPINHLLGLVPGTERFSWPVRIFTRVFLAFFLPPLLLGMISPGATKIAVERAKALGAAIGSVYAWGAAGSIAGTFATGFFLVEFFGSRSVVLLVALALALGGLVLGPKRALHGLWIAVLLAVLLLSRGGSHELRGAAAAAGLREARDTLFSADSAYQHVEVYEESRGPRTLRVMRTDYLQQGWVDPNDPDYVDLNFELVARGVVERCLRPKGPVEAFVIGGGTYTVPRWIVRRWSGARVDVAEIDPLVVEANRRVLGLDEVDGIRTLAMDARNAVDDLDEGGQGARYDLIYADAYGAYSMPFHLTTVEFDGKLAAHLKPGGVYVLNVIDDVAHGRVLGSMIATLRNVFRHVYVFAQHRKGAQPGLDNYVVVATGEPVLTFDWRPGHHLEFPGAALPQQELDALVEKAGGFVLTDDHAPLEQFIAPALGYHKW